jgi:hypothetical protein
MDQRQPELPEGINMKTSELTDAALDWAVAKCEGLLAYGYKDDAGLLLITLSTGEAEYFIPTMKWEQAGPIIERESISVFVLGDGRGWASGFQSGPTPLIAAMRCYVASKLGDEVDIPAELI